MRGLLALAQGLLFAAGVSDRGSREKGSLYPSGFHFELLFSFFFFSSTIFRKIEKLRLIVGGNGVSILDGVLVIDTR